ncbi:hypothetical protein EV426DRAFT_581858 [Tirmania nivea]|nr:hypothetical protein EV426DRAFT_581858 [Tirmania nivea]
MLHNPVMYCSCVYFLPRPLHIFMLCTKITVSRVAVYCVIFLGRKLITVLICLSICRVLFSFLPFPTLISSHCTKCKPFYVPPHLYSAESLDMY